MEQEIVVGERQLVAAVVARIQGGTARTAGILVGRGKVALEQFFGVVHVGDRFRWQGRTPGIAAIGAHAGWSRTSHARPAAANARPAIGGGRGHPAHANQPAA